MARRKLVQIVNRTTEQLDVMYDGTPDIIPAGYRVVRTQRMKPAEGDKPPQPVLDKGEPVFDEKIVGAGPDGAPLTFTCDYFAAEAYKRQHPRMGTQDPFSVDARDTDYLLGVEEWGDDISHLEQTDADELIDRTQLPSHKQNASRIDLGRGGGVRNAKGKKALKEARKQRAKQKAQGQENRRSKFVDDRLAAPTGMKADYTRAGER